MKNIRYDSVSSQPIGKIINVYKKYQTKKNLSECNKFL